MAKEQYKKHRFMKKSLPLVTKIQEITGEYIAMGYTLSVRQLYYQLVSRDVIENNKYQYDRVKRMTKEARIAGVVDWDSIEDRTRGLKGWKHYDNPAEAIRQAAYGYMTDWWTGQACRIECWCEKDALSDVVRSACAKTRTPFMTCKGYTSTTVQRETAERFIRNADKENIILYCGDHDPSGCDMNRQIQASMDLFGAKVQIKRIALTMEQVQAYNPPPNYAKSTDTRYPAYKAKYGEECWELDALRPEIMADLIDKQIRKYLDLSQFEKMQAEEREQEQELFAIAANYAGALQGAIKGVAEI